jgi:antitoxin (DNA-binding transcriptional repressor) of toxin-antitoxin stability system
MATTTVNTHGAKSRLSELIRMVEAGDEVILARNGVVVAKIVPWPDTSRSRTLGAWKGQVSYNGDEVGPDAEIGKMFDEGLEKR